MLGVLLALSLGAAAPAEVAMTSDVLAPGGPLDAFLALCPTAGADWEFTRRSTATLGWRRQEGLSGETPFGAADVYLRGGRTDLLELSAFDGQPSDEPVVDYGSGRGATQMERVAAAEAERKIDEAAAGAGRIRPRVGVAEQSCAIITDAPAEAIIPVLTEKFGFEPGAIEETGARVWLFRMNGATRTPRPMTSMTESTVRAAAAWFGPAASASVMTTVVDGRMRRVVRFTRYHALPHADDVADDGPINVFLDACIRTGADLEAARAAAPWPATTIPGSHAPAFADKGGRLELLSRFQEPTQRACRMRMRGHGYETLVRALTEMLGEAQMTPTGPRWIYIGDPDDIRMMELRDERRFDELRRNWMEIYGEVFVLTVLGGELSMAQLNAYRE